MTARPLPAHDSAAGPDAARAARLLGVDGAALTVRGARAQDLPAVARMHGRCSAKSLLDRYRAGGRPPAVAVLERHVRDPLSFVVTTAHGRVVAVSRVAPDTIHAFGSGEISMLVEDQWQRLGIGRALLRHTAAAAACNGYRQLIGYPGTTASVAHRLMAAVGTTRVVTDPQRHLHTALPGSARLGLGALRGHAASTPAAGALG